MSRWKPRARRDVAGWLGEERTLGGAKTEARGAGDNRGAGTQGPLQKHLSLWEWRHSFSHLSSQTASWQPWESVTFFFAALKQVCLPLSHSLIYELSSSVSWQVLEEASNELKRGRGVGIESGNSDGLWA